MLVSRVVGLVAPTRKAHYYFTASNTPTNYTKTNKRRIDVTVYYVPHVTRRDAAAAGGSREFRKSKDGCWSAAYRYVVESNMFMRHISMLLQLSFLTCNPIHDISLVLVTLQ